MSVAVSGSSKKLTAVWPPPRPKEEDLHGLKYTEAGENISVKLRQLFLNYT